MNIQKEKLLKSYFKLLNETLVLAYNIKPKKMRKNFLKTINSQYHVRKLVSYIKIFRK